MQRIHSDSFRNLAFHEMPEIDDIAIDGETAIAQRMDLPPIPNLFVLVSRDGLHDEYALIGKILFDGAFERSKALFDERRPRLPPVERRQAKRFEFIDLRAMAGADADRRLQ